MAYFESNYMSEFKMQKFVRLCDELLDLPYEIEQYGDKYSIVLFGIQTTYQIETVQRINRHVYHGQYQSF